MNVLKKKKRNKDDIDEILHHLRRTSVDVFVGQIGSISMGWMGDQSVL